MVLSRRKAKAKAQQSKPNLIPRVLSSIVTLASLSPLSHLRCPSLFPKCCPTFAASRSRPNSFDGSTKGNEFSGRVGFLGLGIMGTPMTVNLIRAGCNVTVWNRTKSKCDHLIHLRAKDVVSIQNTSISIYESSPEEVASCCDMTFTILVDPESAFDVACGLNGAVKGMGQGKGAGVQIVGIFLATRSDNGGLIDLQELCSLLCQRRKTVHESISKDDCLRAISKLKALDSGYEAISVGKKKLVRSISTELNKDHNKILELAQVVESGPTRGLAPPTMHREARSNKMGKHSPVGRLHLLF